VIEGATEAEKKWTRITYYTCTRLSGDEKSFQILSSWDWKIAENWIQLAAPAAIRLMGYLCVLCEHFANQRRYVRRHNLTQNAESILTRFSACDQHFKSHWHVNKRIRPGSNAVLHMSRIQFNQLGSCEVRRLTQLSSTDFIWSAWGVLHAWPAVNNAWVPTLRQTAIFTSRTKRIIKGLKAPFWPYLEETLNKTAFVIYLV